MSELTPRQRQTLAARQTFSQRFTSPEEKIEHYRALGQKSAAERIVLPAEDARAFVAARDELTRLTEIVARIAERVENRAAKEGTTEVA